MHKLEDCTTCVTRMAVPGTNHCAMCTVEIQTLEEMFQK